jgi:hypothetical protein
MAWNTKRQKPKIVEALTKKLRRPRASSTSTTCPKSSKCQTARGQEDRQQAGGRGRSGILVQRQHLHVRHAGHRQTGRRRARRLIVVPTGFLRPCVLLRFLTGPTTGTEIGNACPGIVISALRGGSGKTILSIGIIAALVPRGKDRGAVQKRSGLYRCGLAGPGGRPALLQSGHLPHSIPEPSGDLFIPSHPYHADIAVIEGNRGSTTASTPKGPPAPPSWPSCWTFPS